MSVATLLQGALDVMKPEEFKKAWEQSGDRLTAFPEATLKGVPIPLEAQEHLCRAGLPQQAAPFLIFHVPTERLLPRAASGFRIAGEVDTGYVIGSTGSGDPVVVMPTGIVAYLDHDRAFARRYINRSIPIFAATLLQFRGLVEAVGDNHLSEAQKSDFVAFLSQHDPGALVDGGMWVDELAQFAD